MDLLTIIIIAVGLSMDSFAVSIANGLTINRLHLRRILLISLSLAFFQALMPLIGWFAGKSIDQYIRQWDHWIAFVLLLFIGSKMLYEALKCMGEETTKCDLKLHTLIGQSIATSIDAFAVGISFAVIDMEIVTPILLIGLTTFCFSLAGLYLGKYFGNQFGKKVEIFGGILLIGIGVKILIEHLFF